MSLKKAPPGGTTGGDDNRKPAAASASGGGGTKKAATPKTKAIPSLYWAVRKCESLKGSAIFTDWEDCSFYVEQQQDPNDDDDDDDDVIKAEYASCDTAFEALHYIFGSSSDSSFGGAGNNNIGDTFLAAADLLRSPAASETTITATRKAVTSKANGGRAASPHRISRKRPPPDTADDGPEGSSTFSPSKRSKRSKKLPDHLTAITEPQIYDTVEGLDMYNGRDHTWEHNFQLLKEYKEQNGGSLKGVYALRKKKLQGKKEQEKYAILTNYVKAENRRIKRVKELEEKQDVDKISEGDKVKIQRLKDLGYDVAEDIKSRPNPALMKQKRVVIPSEAERQEEEEADPAAAQRSVGRPRANKCSTATKESSVRNERWDEKFEKLIEYKAQHGSFFGVYNLRQNDKKGEEFKVLTNFVHAERRRYQKVQQLEKDDPDSINEKDLEKIEKLKEIGFITEETGAKTDASVPDSRSLSFDEMYEKLKKFKEKHGHVSVPRTEESKQLLNWIVYQKNGYKRMMKGKQTDMNYERLAKLTALGLKVQAEERKPFEVRATEWFEYKMKHGKDPSSIHRNLLGRWARHQRKKYRMKQQGLKTSLTDKQIDQLNAFGFPWVMREPRIVTQPKSWEERYEDLVKYKEKFGNCNVPQKHSSLGGWVHRQRRDYMERKLGLPTSLTPEKVEKLKSLGFLFNVRKSRLLGEKRQRAIELGYIQEKEKPTPGDKNNTKSNDDGDDDDDSSTDEEPEGDNNDKAGPAGRGGARASYLWE